jgi:diguanylate cyclase (GGDEF)-like protein/PAS domain S-box-containing protein
MLAPPLSFKISRSFIYMLGKSSERHPRSRMTRRDYIRRNLRSMILWPLFALFLTLLLWSAMFSKLASEKKQLETNALKKSASISKAYAQYLTRTVEQLDLLAQQIKFGWEKSNGSLNFEKMSIDGVISIPQFASFAIYDDNGIPVTTTIPFTKKFTVLDREYFQFHKTNTSNALRIGTPTIGRLSGKKIIQVTRRIEKNGGAFGGVLVMGIAPEFFTLFSDDQVLGESGILAFIGEDGIERMSKVGNEQRDSAPLAAQKIEPSLATRDTHLFPDGRTRFIATHKLTGYPFFALVGLDQQDVLQPYERNRMMYRKLAIAGTGFFFLFSLFAMWMSIRLAWRNHQAKTIRETYRLATEGGNEGFYILLSEQDKSGFITDFIVVDCNEKGASFFGLSKDKFLGAKVSDYYSGEYFERVMKTYRLGMENGFYEDDYRIPEGSPLKAEWVKRKFVRADKGLAITLRDISESKRHEREMSRLATEDALTTLPNRHWLMNYLPAALITAQTNKSMLAVLFIDLDDFKNVNDTLGHSAGDQLLCAVAARLKSVVRSSDKVIRLGGDEFTVVLEAIHNEDEVAHIASAINQVLHEPFELTLESTPKKNKVGGSIGIALFPRDGHDVETLLKNADIAMYAAKINCKGEFRFYDRMLYENIKLRLDTEQDLTQAIREDQFELYFQPRVATSTGTLTGMEALIRWRHPTRGLIPANEFISLAEETGKINAIGEIVIDKVCAQIAAWLAQGIQAVPVSVNVSAHQFNDGKVKNLIAACLAKHSVPVSLLEIELTESAMMRNTGDIFDEISAINKMGTTMYVDDFGSGYSSLSLLQRLDMDVLKVHQAFTAQLGIAKDGEIFFTAIVSMAKALDMRVVAEGVETPAQLNILQTLACDEVQGCYIAQPMPAAEVPALIAKRNLFH